MARTPARLVVGGTRRTVLAVALAASLVAACVGTGPGSSARPTAAAAGTAQGASSFLLGTPRLAPPIELTDSNGSTFSLASFRGSNTLVFFGYTHCPDVCPATIGIIGETLAGLGSGTRAAFVTIDPERDTVAWLKEYSQFMPRGFVVVTGTAAEIRTTADAWGVRYARVDSGSASGYSMSHTADVYLVDAFGVVRADFPFGTESDAMTSVVRAVTASGQAVVPPTPVASQRASMPAASASTGGVADLHVEVVSTSVWAEPGSPVILAISTPAGPVTEAGIDATVQLRAADGSASGDQAAAVPVRPAGETHVFYVARLDIAGAGTWSLEIAITVGAVMHRGSVALQALDPGTTPHAGSAAPTVHTPTLADVAGIARAITTDPNPDLRLSQRSTTDALADHIPFVLVIDSPKFRVSPACGKAVIMARYLADRWPDVGFIHLEPYVYTIVTDTPVLSGDLANPPLTTVADAWGVGSAPLGARSMPWAFVVDRNGRVQAKYQGLMGTDDVDVILSLLAAGG